MAERILGSTMPTYEYKCKECGHTFEKFQQMQDRVMKKCPTCGKLKLVRLIGAGSAILFRGTGFYQTDYRSNSYKQGKLNVQAKERTDTGTPKISEKHGCSKANKP